MMYLVKDAKAFDLIVMMHFKNVMLFKSYRFDDCSSTVDSFKNYASILYW